MGDEAASNCKDIEVRFVTHKHKLSCLAMTILGCVVLAFYDGSREKQAAPDLFYHAQNETVVRSDPDGTGPLPSGEPRLEGALVIDFVDGFTPEDLRDFRKETGLRVGFHSIHSLESALTVAELPESEMPGMIEQLQRDPRVEAVSPNYIYSLEKDGAATVEVDNSAAPLASEENPGFPNDPGLKFQWHLEQIQCRDAWRWTSGEGVVVAVIDTGVAYADTPDGTFHRVEDLADTKIVEGYDFIHNRVEAYDDHCHGTHVAGTVAQSTNNGRGVAGVAFGSAVMPVKVLSARGGGTNAGVADGIRFAADNGAKVLNLSLGGPSRSTVLDTAVKHAVSKGALVVCAAGNSNTARPGYPAGCEGAISVSSVDFERNLAFYSNHGPSITVAAPGGDTRYDKNGDGMPDGVYQNTIKPMNPLESGYYMFQGTSMASPHAAGVFALGVSLGVTNQKLLQQVVYATASPAPEGAREGYGAGIVDAGALTRKLGLEWGRAKLGLGLAMGLLAFAFYFRRGRFGKIALLLPGVLVGACGILWWIPALGLNQAPLSPYLVNGFPAWDIFLMGAQNHGSYFTHSALVPLAVCAVAALLRLLKPMAAGFAAGVAGHLVFVAAYQTAQINWLPENLQTLWLIANAFFCLALSVLAASRD